MNVESTSENAEFYESLGERLSIDEHEDNPEFISQVPLYTMNVESTSENAEFYESIVERFSIDESEDNPEFISQVPSKSFRRSSGVALTLQTLTESTFNKTLAAVSCRDILFNFYFAWLLHILVFSLLGAIVLSVVDGQKYYDSFFNCVSAITSTGLAVNVMTDFSTASLVTIAVLMFLGNLQVLQWLVVTFRRMRFNRIYKAVRDSSKIVINVPEYENLALELKVVGDAYLLSIVANHIIGFLLLTGALHIFPAEPGISFYNENN